jgi:very-short-patch-repair endonuclease
MKGLHLPEEILTLARLRHGALLTSDLRRANLGPAAQHRRAQAGVIQMPLRGVIVVTELSDRLTPLAALQLRYPDVVCERRAAAAVFGLDGFTGPGPVPLDLVDLTHGRPPAARGVPPIRTARLPNRAITVHEGLRTTTPTWTLGELGAAGVDADGVELALESALRQGFTTEAKLRRVVTDRSGPPWPGTPVLAEALCRRRPGDPPTESYAETRFLQLVVRPAGLEDPERQVPVQIRGGRGAYRCDFVFRRERPLDVEIDGRAGHASDADRDYDSVRDHDLEQAGMEVVRFAASRVERRPSQVTGQLLAELAMVSR